MRIPLHDEHLPDAWSLLEDCISAYLVSNWAACAYLGMTSTFQTPDGCLLRLLLRLPPHCALSLLLLPSHRPLQFVDRCFQLALLYTSTRRCCRYSRKRWCVVEEARRSGGSEARGSGGSPAALWHWHWHTRAIGSIVVAVCVADLDVCWRVLSTGIFNTWLWVPWLLVESIQRLFRSSLVPIKARLRLY